MLAADLRPLCIDMYATESQSDLNSHSDELYCTKK